MKPSLNVWVRVITPILLLTGLAVQAADPVYSVNRFGYQKVRALAENYRLVGMPFTVNPATPNEIIGDQLTPGLNPATADTIIMWDPVGQRYRSVYYLFEDPEDPGNPYNYKWIDTGVDPNVVVTSEVPAGVGFWVRTRQPSDQSVTLIGEIATEGAFTNIIRPGMQILAYPYSTPIAINDMAFVACGAQAGSGPEDADTIFTWDPATRTYRYYYLLEDVGNMNYNFKWIDMGVEPNEVATNRIMPGQAFWYRHRGTAAFNWIEQKPY